VRPGNDITLYIVFFFMSVMALVPYQIGWSIIPDCVEVDEYKTGARREGLYYGTVNFIQKGGSALAIFAGGLMLEMVGYNSELATQTAETMEGVRLILVGGTAIMTIMGIVFLAFYPLSKAKHGTILDAIEARKNGKEVDESIFKDCLS
jgi:GPH family glycoside/pentoside/hexuronide:cation symporter